LALSLPYGIIIIDKETETKTKTKTKRSKEMEEYLTPQFFILIGYFLLFLIGFWYLVTKDWRK